MQLEQNLGHYQAFMMELLVKIVNSSLANVSILHPFWCFQGLYNENIGQKWLNEF